MEEHHGNVMAAAAAMGIHRTTLWRRLRQKIRA
nr:helix-turn-helix domain-containing protein [Desulfovibrio sp.]